MNFSKNKIFNFKVCGIKPFFFGFGPNPIEHRAKTGRLHCLLHSYSCGIHTDINIEINIKNIDMEKAMGCEIDINNENINDINICMKREVNKAFDNDRTL